MNVVAFRTSEDDWRDNSRLTKPAKREDALRDFEGYGDNVMSVLKLADPELDIVSILLCCHRETLSDLVDSGLSFTLVTIPFLPSRKVAFA